MTDRKNLKVADGTYELLRKHKRDMETWDQMLRRVVKASMHDMVSDADEEQSFRITERVPYVDEPELREHVADNQIEASNILSQIESPQVGSEVVDVELLDEIER